jgi:Fe2+ or Zn2+ uptake regulation protein
MSKKRGLSLEEKRERMIEIFYEKKEVFQLKDLEKIAPKEKGITAQTVKEVLQSLVDDGKIDSDKIGTSVYFWAFPSKAFNQKKQKLETLRQSSAELKKAKAAIENDFISAQVSMACHFIARICRNFFCF